MLAIYSTDTYSGAQLPLWLVCPFSTFPPPLPNSSVLFAPQWPKPRHRPHISLSLHWQAVKWAQPLPSPRELQLRGDGGVAVRGGGGADCQRAAGSYQTPPRRELSEAARYHRGSSRHRLRSGKLTNNNWSLGKGAGSPAHEWHGMQQIFPCDKYIQVYIYTLAAAKMEEWKFYLMYLLFNENKGC